MILAILFIIIILLIIIKPIIYNNSKGNFKFWQQYNDDLIHTTLMLIGLIIGVCIFICTIYYIGVNVELPAQHEQYLYAINYLNDNNINSSNKDIGSTYMTMEILNGLIKFNNRLKVVKDTHYKYGYLIPTFFISKEVLELEPIYLD